MRNYFLLLFLVLVSALLSACGGSSDIVNANANANLQTTPQYADAKTAFDEGSKFFEAGREELAIEALKQAVAFDPDLAEAHFKLGMAYSIVEEDKNAEQAFEAAVEAYKRIVKEDPDDAQSWFNLGRSYNKLNKDKEAEEALRRAVKLKPDDGGYNTEMGAILIKLAQYPEALVFLKKALEIDPEDPRAAELREKAEDGRRRVEMGIPAGTNTNKSNGSASTNKSANTANSAVNTNRPANTTVPPANKKPDVKSTPD